jgi:hypothetical protein
MSRFSSVDIVIMLLTCLVSVLLILSTIGIIIGKITHPEIDFTGGEKVIGNIITTVVGALVGFVGGRATGRAEGANGNGKVAVQPPEKQEETE